MDLGLLDNTEDKDQSTKYSKNRGRKLNRYLGYESTLRLAQRIQYTKQILDQKITALLEVGPPYSTSRDSAPIPLLLGHHCPLMH